MSVMDEDSSFIKWCCCKMYYTLTMESEELKKESCVWTCFTFILKQCCIQQDIINVYRSSCKVTVMLAYLLTPWCRVLIEKLTGLQLVKKFPAFHGTRRFITALTRLQVTAVRVRF